jgi:hypothetical protein
MGCAKEDALSDQQKDQLVRTFDSAGKAYNAGRSSAASASSNKTGKIDAIPVVKRMSNLLNDKIKSKACRMRFIAPHSYSLAYSPRFSLLGLLFNRDYPGTKRIFAAVRIWGEQDCPINLDFRIGTLSEPSIGRFAISYDYSYFVSDDDYRSLNDVDAMELHGGISTNGLNLDQAWRETDLQGSMHSQSTGDISISASGQLSGPDQNSLSGNVFWTFGYPGFSAEFKESYDTGSISYSLNDESISRDDFNRFFSRGGEPLLFSSDPDQVH